MLISNTDNPPGCRIVITGGAGFLGVRLARTLLAQGRLDAQAQQISGNKASKTIALHTRIYAAAMATLEELEETARLMLLMTAPIEPLNEAQLQELRQTFGARW